MIAKWSVRWAFPYPLRCPVTYTGVAENIGALLITKTVLNWRKNIFHVKEKVNYLKSLNRGKIPKEILDGFRKKNLPLSCNAILSTTKAGEEWEICDGKNKFKINRENNLLKMEWAEEADKKIPWLFRVLSDIPGYCVGWDYYEEEKPKKWSEEAKKKARRKRFEKRVKKNFPLFAEAMIEEYKDYEEKTLRLK